MSIDDRVARLLTELPQSAQFPTQGATLFVDLARQRVQKAYTPKRIVESLLAEHSNETSALESQLSVMRLANVSLRDVNASLVDLLDLGVDLEASLRAEIRQQAVGIDQLQRLVNPPFSLRFLRSAKVGIPMVAVGVALGFLFSN